MRSAKLVTPEQVANARRNVRRFDWAAARRDAAIERAKRWVCFDDDRLWSMVTGQTIGRSTNASVEKGCPKCGQGIYRQGGRFDVDVLADPWKIRCPSCSGRFPTNDFRGVLPERDRGERDIRPRTCGQDVAFQRRPSGPAGSEAYVRGG